MTAAIVGFQISMPLSNELTVGISQNEPGHVPAEPRAVVEVGADAERVARAGDDADPRVVVGAEPLPRRVEVVAQLAVDRVAHLGAVDT